MGRDIFVVECSSALFVLGRKQMVFAAVHRPQVIAETLCTRITVLFVRQADMQPAPTSESVRCSPRSPYSVSTSDYIVMNLDNFLLLAIVLPRCMARNTSFTTVFVIF